MRVILTTNISCVGRFLTDHLHDVASAASAARAPQSIVLKERIHGNSPLAQESWPARVLTSLTSTIPLAFLRLSTAPPHFGNLLGSKCGEYPDDFVSCFNRDLRTYPGYRLAPVCFGPVESKPEDRPEQ